MIIPYPPDGWREITGFEYTTPLHLTRFMEAVKMRSGYDASYMVAHPYIVTVTVDGEALPIEVPEGMFTDLASVPRPLWWAIDRVGPHLEAAIVHDWLYQAWSVHGLKPKSSHRRFADEVFLAGMESAKVSLATRTLIYRSVRVFGARAFRLADRRLTRSELG